ncbi:hypothetical protein [Roseovarius indicus]|uniref:hypothetical protein n=1 Tax=Roseovarius indicus TaxID=540747 RepID=UPI0015A4F9BD|nr:hypothetical protein [Roseovarius indicus]
MGRKLRELFFHVVRTSIPLVGLLTGPFGSQLVLYQCERYTNAKPTQNFNVAEIEGKQAENTCVTRGKRFVRRGLSRQCGQLPGEGTD